jgi:ubiquinone/menaquinone biosynthesis C-methylase UbiE
MTSNKNPWTLISPEDYEGHMSSLEVNQLHFLSDCFKQALTHFDPSEVAIVGCGTGNGLEHIDTAYTKRMTVVDINSNFLEVLKKRYKNRIKGLEVIHDDLNNCILQNPHYSLIFAGLVFEFVETTSLLKKISKWLRTNAIFRVVLQIPNKYLPDVSETKFESLKNLNSIVKLVDVEQFRNECKRLCLNEIESSIETLKSGKSFYIGTFKKSHA